MLDKGVETVVESKKILLFKTMLEDIKYDDMEVVNLLVSGVKVVVTLERFGIWRPDDKPAKLSLRAALHGATSANMISGGPSNTTGRTSTAGWCPARMPRLQMAI